MNWVDWLNWLGMLAALVAAAGAILAYRAVVTRERAERELVSKLLRRQRFVSALLAYLEQLDRDGEGLTESQARAITDLIAQELETGGPEARFILDAIYQPSPRGRRRYVEKLLDEAGTEFTSKTL
jgi:hypothetical protein